MTQASNARKAARKRQAKTPNKAASLTAPNVIRDAKIRVVMGGRTYVCELDPKTNAIDLNSCVPIVDPGGSALAASVPHETNIAASLRLVLDRAASMDQVSERTLGSEAAAAISPAVRQACFAVAQRTAQFRKHNQILITQLSALDLDRTALAFPQDVGEAMFAAEQTRISLIKAFADFDTKCSSVEMAARKIAEFH